MAFVMCSLSEDGLEKELRPTHREKEAALEQWEKMEFCITTAKRCAACVNRRDDALETQDEKESQRSSFISTLLSVMLPEGSAFLREDVGELGSSGEWFVSKRELTECKWIN